MTRYQMEWRNHTFLHGFSNSNFGFIIGLNKTKILHLITWNELLLGYDVGLKLSSQRNNSRNLYSLFSNKCRSPDLLMLLLHNFHLEYYGDRFSTLALICLWHKASLTQSLEEASSMRKIIIQLEPPMLNGDNFNKLLSAIDCVFQRAIRRICTEFSDIRGYLITDNERSAMINKHKCLMPNHCSMSKKL